MSEATYNVAVRLALDQPLEDARTLIARRLDVALGDLRRVELLKRSIDARGRGVPMYDLLYRVGLETPLTALPSGIGLYSPPEIAELPLPSASLLDEQIVVLGAGPCGLFAAHSLADRGIRVTVLDRGEAVGPRAKKVSRLMGKGQLDPDSNLCFGEGGAGTFSDGKLYTRVGGKEVPRVLQTLIAMGAPRDILIERRPHLGTDRLIKLLKGMRLHLESIGVRFRFGTRVDAISMATNGKRGVLTLDGGVRLEADRVILAIGHSARALYRQLADAGVAMEAKPFSVGYRVEHPQQLINETQFGPISSRMKVPAAEYKLAWTRGTGDLADRVYSFCMCPGGSVVPTATRPGELSVNGMSHAARTGHYANSAIVTQLKPQELAVHSEAEGSLLAGIRFQEAAERAAYTAGQGDFAAPASTVPDFLAGRASKSVRRTTYRCGVSPADLDPLYPRSVQERLRAGLERFEGRMRGFLTADAVLIGVETRTSSPIRILRGPDGRSPTHPFLYPAGEGAGYAGGITSAAVDGIRVARWILGGC